MKVTPTQYADALYEATKDKSQEEVGGFAANLAKVLAHNNQLRLKDKIIAKFSEIYNRENSIVEAEVISREKLDEEVRTKVRTSLMIKYGAKEVILNNIIDPNIKGGIIIKVGDDVMDGTVDRQLAELKSCLNH